MAACCLPLFLYTVAPAADHSQTSEVFKTSEVLHSVQLMRPDSLAGWDYGEQPIRGWTIQRGHLAGSGRATPLLSGYTLGDFRLHFAWAVNGDGKWKVLFPNVPSGEGLELVLSNGAGCGQLRDGNNLLARGADLTADTAKRPKNSLGYHYTEIVRRGAKFSVTVDRWEICEVAVDAGRRFGLGLAIEGDRAGGLADMTLQEPPGEPIFNGKDLAGWWTPGDINAWGAEDGQLVFRKGGGNYIRTKKEYGNFTVSLEYRIQNGGNSGVGIRTPMPGWPSGDGMELQIWDIPYNTPLDKHAAMAIYGNVPPLARADRLGQWNRVVIKADGRMISAWMNGQLVQQYNTAFHPELKHRHLAGWIGIQEHGATMQLRDLRVLEAPAGLGLEAWQKPRPPSGATLVLDRLMNPERLSAADRLPSGAVSTHVSGPQTGGQVLAELTGPGAVVRIARTSDEGRLSFYFDGESKPRLVCKPADLAKSVPPVAEDANPVLTYLAYQSRLKIVLEGAKRGDYRIDYVTFPQGLDVPSFTATDPGIPRGWLSALAYRREQLGWGTHREFDPRPRDHSANGARSPQKTIAPGKTEQLLHLDGAGIVHWLKLKADKKVLAQSDLWLEVTFGGREGAGDCHAGAILVCPVGRAGELAELRRAGPRRRDQHAGHAVRRRDHDRGGEPRQAADRQRRRHRLGRARHRGNPQRHPRPDAIARPLPAGAAAERAGPPGWARPLGRARFPAAH